MKLVTTYANEEMVRQAAAIGKLSVDQVRGTRRAFDNAREWFVPTSNLESFYVVTMRKEQPSITESCTCPDHVSRNRACKHMRFVETLGTVEGINAAAYAAVPGLTDLYAS